MVDCFGVSIWERWGGLVCRAREMFRSRLQQGGKGPGASATRPAWLHWLHWLAALAGCPGWLAGWHTNLVRTVDERAAERTRGNPRDSDSTGGLNPKLGGHAASVSLPGFAGRDLGR
jgi:hypothetical protein